MDYNEYIKDLFGESWYNKLGDYLTSPDFIALGQKIAQLRQTQTIIPSKMSPLLFRAFKTTPFDQLKVVIIGQDPYHTRNADGTFVYDGLAFSNSNSFKAQPSLKNILKEVENDIYDGCNPDRLANYSLYGWAAQGVLLINSAHTVEVGNPGGHIEIWRGFTKKVIETINDKDDIVWMLWGNFAKDFKVYITNSTHYILEGAHPSPLAGGKFFGGKYFSRCNEFLKSCGKEEILW